MNKVTTLDQVMERVHDGMTIMIGGFNGICAPIKCIERLAKSGVKDITLISVTCGYPGGGFDLAPLFVNKQIKKVIASHIGTSPEAVKVFKSGDMEVEYFPMGIWIEKIRAGGYGLGGVVSPIGIGTMLEAGKQKVTIQGKEYLIELPLRADVAFIKGYRADRMGNVQHRMVSPNTNVVIASAADYTVVEVNEIVDIGGIEPDRVGIPGVFIKAVVQGNAMEDHHKIYEDLWVRTGNLKPKKDTNHE
jgi:acetate CoA/acetoacetate CoA-transferase alpha subunit